MIYATDPTSTWTTKTIGFTTNDIGFCRYGNGYWLACGPGGKMSYASTPSGTWTYSASAMPLDYAFNALYAAGYWVVVGSNGSIKPTVAVATTVSGTWTAYQLASGPATGLVDVIYKDGTGWIVIDNVGALYTTSDPTSTWTSHAIASVTPTSIVYANGRYLVTTTSNAIYVSEDLSHWEIISVSSSAANTALYVNNKWLISGLSTTLATGFGSTTNTYSWISQSVTGGTVAAPVNDMRYANGTAVAVSTGNVIWVSNQ